MSDKKSRRPGYLWSLVHHKCSRCRRGDMFQCKNSYNLKQFMKMNDRCPVCDQKMEIEVGFYYGTSYVSYALTVAFSVFTFVAWWVLIGFSIDDNRIFYWLTLNSVLLVFLQPIFMRLSRSIWLSWFVKYDPDWKEHQPDDVTERLNADQANNW